MWCLDTVQEIEFEVQLLSFFLCSVGMLDALLIRNNWPVSALVVRQWVAAAVCVQWYHQSFICLFWWTISTIRFWFLVSSQLLKRSSDFRRWFYLCF